VPKPKTSVLVREMVVGRGGGQEHDEAGYIKADDAEGHASKAAPLRGAQGALDGSEPAEVPGPSSLR